MAKRKLGAKRSAKNDPCVITPTRHRFVKGQELIVDLNGRPRKAVVSRVIRI